MDQAFFKFLFRRQKTSIRGQMQSMPYAMAAGRFRRIKQKGLVGILI
jgi:hypothetical protein